MRRVKLYVMGVSKWYGGIKAITQVSFEAEAGKIVALVGPNGAGKSTVLAAIAGEISIDKGDILFDTLNLANAPLERNIRNGVALVRQHSKVLLNTSVREYLLYATIQRKDLDDSYSRSRAMEAMAERCGIDYKLDKQLTDLSYGELRRVEFARALLLQAKILLIDEPFAGLGEGEIRELEKLIVSERDTGKIVILVDHDIKAVRRLADCVVLMELGQIVEIGQTSVVMDGQKLREIYLGQEINVDDSTARRRRTAGGRCIIETRRLSVDYSKLVALHEVDLDLQEGQILGLIGLNGAGKTSLLNAICGLVNYRGDVRFNGDLINKTRHWRRIDNGIGYVPEGRGLFAGLTVGQHLILASKQGMGGKTRLESELEILFPQLLERWNQRGGSLSGGEQQMLTICRAIVAKPKCLLVDEPTLGLAPNIIERIGRALSKMAGDGMAILMSEQNTRFVESIGDSYVLLKNGRKISQGDAVGIANNKDVLQEMVGAL